MVIFQQDGNGKGEGSNMFFFSKWIGPDFLLYALASSPALSYKIIDSLKNLIYYNDRPESSSSCKV